MQSTWLLCDRGVLHGTSIRYIDEQSIFRTIDEHFFARVRICKMRNCAFRSFDDRKSRFRIDPRIAEDTYFLV